MRRMQQTKFIWKCFEKKKRHWFGRFFGFRLRVGPWGEWQPALMVTVRFLARKTIWITLSSFPVLLKDTDQKFILAFGPFGLGKATAAISDQYQRGKKKRRDFFFLRRSTFPALVVACCSRAGFWLGIWFFLSGSVPFGSKFHKLNTLLQYFHHPSVSNVHMLSVMCCSAICKEDFELF